MYTVNLLVFGILMEYKHNSKVLKKKIITRVYGIARLFKCLLLQFLEDLSDRELERYLQENVASKWFCGFELTEVTPDHTVFSRVR